MSGGSFGYLCFEDTLADLAAKRHELERMHAALCELPYARVPATETARVLAMLERAESRVSALEELRAVWKAVEWWASGDWSEDRVRQVIRDYEDGAL